jgi:ABC-2 type transport system permease protein
VAVLAKAGIPLIVLPLWGLVVVVVAQLAILLVGVLASLLSGTDPTPLLAPSAWFRAPRVAYGLAVHALWHAPLYAWLLLASAWARRMPLLWAILPPFALAVFERVAFGTTHVAAFLRWRLWAAEAFDDPTAPGGFGLHLTPFLASSGLWAGLISAALFLAAAIRLRRAREAL